MIDEIEQRRLADPAFADNRDGLRPRRPYARKDLGDLAGAPEKLRGVPDCYSIQVWIAWHFGCESSPVRCESIIGIRAIRGSLLDSRASLPLSPLARSNATDGSTIEAD